MGEFLHKYNTDNVHSRAVIVGLVNLLNSKIFFDNILSDSETDTVYVPFFYNMGGDERFLQDYFLEWNDCIHPRHADGNYDVIPRGIVTMSSKTIDTAKMTHRFVRGNYVKEVSGELQTYSAYLNSLPITMNFDIELEVDSNLDAFKIEQSIMETFYKVQVFSVSFKGLRIPCQAGFAEDYAVEKTFEFSYQANNKIGVKFSITVETYYPVFDSTTERSNSNRVSGFNQVDVSSERYLSPRFVIDSPIANEKYFSGGIMPISWTNTGPIQRVNLYYRLAGSSTWRKFANNINNNGFYDWRVPFIDGNGNEIPTEPQKLSVISDTGRDSYIRAITDVFGSVDSVVVLDPGFSYTNGDPIQMSIIGPTGPNPQAPIPLPPQIEAVVQSGGVIGATIITNGANFFVTPLNEIEIKIEDANTELTYQYLLNTVTFTGDVDSSLPSPDNTKITNISPSLSFLLQNGNLVGKEITGLGVPTGSKITNLDIGLNAITINNVVTGQHINTEIQVEPIIAKVEIQ